MRRRRQFADSLDMLLDTITNTFGGIVFLALLIVLLMGSAKPVTSKSDELRESRILHQEIEELLNRRNELTQSRSAQQIVSTIMNFNTDSQLADKVKQLATQYGELRGQINDLIQQNETISKQVSELDSNVDKIDQAMVVANEDKNNFEQNLQREIEKRTQEIDLPKERASFKRQQVVAVANSRLYTLDANRGQLLFSVNEEHFESCNAGNALVILSNGAYRPKSNAGISLADQQQIEREISRFDRDNSHLTIAIQNDSFGDFHTLRDNCKQISLEYELILLKPGDKISESARVGQPKVQ